MVAEAFERAGTHGLSRWNLANTLRRRWKLLKAWLERGYLSHHMVTDVEKMQVVLDNPFILMTDHKIRPASSWPA